MCYSGKCKLESSDGECNVRRLSGHSDIIAKYGISACYIGESPYDNDSEAPTNMIQKTPEELMAIRKELKEKGWIL